MRTKAHILALHLAVAEALLLSKENGYAEVCVYEVAEGCFEQKMMYDPPTPGAKPLFYLTAAEEKIEDPMAREPELTVTVARPITQSPSYRFAMMDAGRGHLLP